VLVEDVEVQSVDAAAQPVAGKDAACGTQFLHHEAVQAAGAFKDARRQGPGRMPTMRSIEKTAYIWANRDITTLDRAEDHLRAERARREETERVKQALQIRGRELTPTERKYIDAWLELGFTAEALAIAYDRTVIKTGSLHWKYMNSIVSSWHGKGLHSPEEIEKGDCRAPAAASGGEHGGGDLDWMEQQLGLK